MFEGTAIYNLLREYEGHVTVKVLGIAASAASIIAMAGDDIQIAAVPSDDPQLLGVRDGKPP